MIKNVFLEVFWVLEILVLFPLALAGLAIVGVMGVVNIATLSIICVVSRFFLRPVIEKVEKIWPGKIRKEVEI